MRQISRPTGLYISMTVIKTSNIILVCCSVNDVLSTCITLVACVCVWDGVQVIGSVMKGEQSLSTVVPALPLSHLFTKTHSPLPVSPPLCRQANAIAVTTTIAKIHRCRPSPFESHDHFMQKESNLNIIVKQ